MEVGWERVRLRAPEFAPGAWLNSEPLSLRSLRGRVVLVDFWDYTCVNCLRTLPYLAEWHRRYAPWVTIVGVHSPEFTFAQATGFVQQAVHDYGLEYPIVLDNEYRTWYAYANRYWPAKYLIDKDGYLRYKRFGEGHYAETEAAIQTLIREVDPTASLSKPMAPLRDEDADGAVCYRATPELYAGHERGDLGNDEGYAAGNTVAYRDPGTYAERKFYLDGAWRSLPEALVAAEAGATLILPYAAAQVNAVLSPTAEAVSGAPTVRLEISLDGEPLTLETAGEDARLADGASWVEVDRPRMYNLVVNRGFGAGVLRLTAAAPGVAVYAFTFVSCVAPPAERVETAGEGQAR